MPKTKIVRIITRLNIGGPSIHAKLLHEGLRQNDFLPYLIYGKVGEEEGDMSYIFASRNGNIFHIPSLIREISPIKDLIAFFRIFLLLLKLRPNIVHTHMSKAGTLGRLASTILNMLGFKIRIVHTYHGHVFEGYFEGIKTKFILLIERYLAKRTHALISLTEGQRHELCEKYRIAPCNKFHIIPLGFELTPFLDLRSSQHKKIPTKIGIIGRLVPIKNHELFFKAARLLLNKKQDLEFWVVGDGERRKELETFVRSLGLDKKVIFQGWIKEMPKVYEKLDLVVLCSLNEGTPVTIIEAMASGVPVVSTDVGGIREILGEKIKEVRKDKIFHCKRGILCASNEPIDLAMAIEYSLSMNLHERDLMIRNAREFTIAVFSKERLIQDIQRLYKTLIGA